MKWYAVFVTTGKEEDVKRMFQRKLGEENCKCCIPKRKVPEKKDGQTCHVVRTMFPGYVFVHAKMDFKFYYKLMTIPNIVSFLNYSNQKDLKFHQVIQDEQAFFKHIPDEEMSELLTLINNENDTMEYSEFYFQNGSMTILSGPLAGREEKIKKIDKRKKRAKISIRFLGKENLIDIGYEALNPLTELSDLSRGEGS